MVVYKNGSLNLSLKQPQKVTVQNSASVCVCVQVFLNRAEAGRGQAGGDLWEEDLEWTHQLDQGWDLQVVRHHARSLLKQHDMSLLSVSEQWGGLTWSRH